MPARPRTDESPAASAARFRVLLDGHDLPVAHVVGLAHEPHPQRRADDQPRVTLSRAVTGDRTLFDWAEHVDDREVVVEVLSADGGRPVAAWALLAARPVRWTGPDLDAVDGRVAMESVELTYDRVEWRLPRAGR